MGSHEVTRDRPTVETRGVPVGVGHRLVGTARFVPDVATVIALMEDDVSDLILIVPVASATGIAPILPDAKAVVCTSGGPTSHLALVAKEFGVPCVVGAPLDTPEELDGRTLTVEPDGLVRGE